MPKMWRYLLIVCMPLFAGMIASIIIANATTNPVFVFKIELSFIFFLTGLIFSIVIGAIVLSLFLSRKQHENYLAIALQQREDSHQRFLRRLDHEIKNPLTTLQAVFTNLHEAGSKEETQIAEQNARNATQRLTRLLGDLRKLSELQARQFEHLPVDIPELLEEMIDAARSLPQYHERNITLIVSKVPWKLSPLSGDRDLLGVAIYNLIDNALKFSQPADTIEVRALEVGRSLVIEVADNGPGIPPEDVAHVFEELYRGANAHAAPGSGLGLALVERIIALHGGDISVRSRQQNDRGTIFTIRFPVTNL